MSGRDLLRWSELPPLPDPEGFAGSFAGVSQGALVVAGGANFPEKRPWEGGRKVWHDRIFVLEPGAATWRIAGQLPRASGYGVSLTIPEGVLFIGGGDAERNFAEVWLAQWDSSSGGRIRFLEMPSLPRPLAMQSGGLAGRTVYVAGGLDRPDATQAQRVAFALDLDGLERGWRELEPWPGSERFLATGGVQDGAFYLIGGARLMPGPGGAVQREWLRDGWCYRPGAGWKPIADLPQPMVAAPSPAPAFGPAHLLVLGGDDGSLVATAPREHPGFPRTVWAYHAVTDTWARFGELPFSLVTTAAVPWDGGWVIPGGEARPGVRSTEVWSAQARPRESNLGGANYAALAGYLAAIVGVGLWFSRRQKTTNDYFKAGGRIPWWAVGLSIYATMLSSITFMAIPAKAYATDWTFALANVSLLLLAPIVIKFYLPFFRRLQITSAYEYLERRFNVVVRLYASAAFVLFHCGRMAIVIYLPSIALAAACGLEVRTCILLIGTLCVVYTTVGGIEAVVWTDAVQSVILLGAAVLSLGLIVSHVDGGWSGLWAEAVAYDKLRWLDLRWDATAATVWVILLGNLFGNLGPYTADQTVVQRYVTTRDTRQAARAIWTNAWLALPSTALFFAIGTALFVFYRQHPESLEPTLGTDAVFPMFIAEFMPPGVAGLVIAGVFAAAQSTVSSSLNSIVAALITDFLRRFRPHTSDTLCLRLAKALSIAVGALGTVLALVLAAAGIRSLWDAYLGLLGMLASGLAGLFALGIFSRRAHGAGALIGALVSALVLWWVQRHTSIHFFLYGLIGFTTCCAVGWLVSAIWPVRVKKDLAGLTWRTPEVEVESSYASVRRS
jgi:solute:Na+ symporter, SSS family